MKPSHYRTPRTLSEGAFSVGYPCISYRKERPFWRRIAMCLFAALCLLLIVRM